MLKEKGRYYELPIEGGKIQRIVYDGLIRIVFDDPHESHLDLHGEFKVHQYNQVSTFLPRDREALIFFYDLHHAASRIKEAKADKSGQLFLTFDNGVELMVEDGPYENWHLAQTDQQKHGLYIHGGVGRTIIFHS